MKRRGFVRATAGALAALGLLPHRGEWVESYTLGEIGPADVVQHGGGFLVTEEVQVEVEIEIMATLGDNTFVLRQLAESFDRVIMEELS